MNELAPVADGAAHICATCKAPVTGNYCTHCGQSRESFHRSIWALGGDLISDIFSFDSRLLRTAVALLFRPGELPLAFHQGRTQPYVPALRLYFFVTLIFFVMLSFTGLAIVQIDLSATPAQVVRDAKGNTFIRNPDYVAANEDSGERPLIPVKMHYDKNGKPKTVFSYNIHSYFFAPMGKYHSAMPKEARDHFGNFDTAVANHTGNLKKLTPQQRQKADAAEAKITDFFQRDLVGGFLRLTSNPAALNGTITTWIPRALFLLMPLYALLLAAFYWRQRKTFFFIDHVIFSLTVHTFTFAVLLVAAGLAQFMSGTAVAWLVFFAISIYIFLAMRRFYAQGWFITTIKFLTVSWIYTFIFLIPALSGILVYSFLGGSSA